MATVDLMTVEEMRRDLAEDDAEPSLSYEEERGKPMPSNLHSIIQTNLIGEFLKHREFRTQSELDLEVEGRKLVPDLSVYRREPVDFSHDILRRSDPPLLTVEIVSPKQGYFEVMEKMDAYFRHGVKSCWIITPPMLNVTIFTPDGARRTISEGIATDPVIGISADLAAVFS